MAVAIEAAVVQCLDVFRIITFQLDKPSFVVYVIRQISIRRINL